MDRNAKARAERRHVGPVGRIDRVAGVESYEPFGCDAGHGAPVHNPLPCQGLGGKVVRGPRRTVTAAAAFVEHDHVEVNLMPGGIAKNEIPGTGVRTRNRCVSATLERSRDQRDISFLDDDVEVGVMPGLRPEAGVNRPAAIEPDPNTVTVREAQEVAYILRGHFWLSYRPGHRETSRRP